MINPIASISASNFSQANESKSIEKHKVLFRQIQESITQIESSLIEAKKMPKSKIKEQEAFAMSLSRRNIRFTMEEINKKEKEHLDNIFKPLEESIVSHNAHQKKIFISSIENLFEVILIQKNQHYGEAWLHFLCEMAKGIPKIVVFLPYVEHEMDFHPYMSGPEFSKEWVQERFNEFITTCQEKLDAYQDPKSGLCYLFREPLINQFDIIHKITASAHRETALKFLPDPRELPQFTAVDDSFIKAFSEYANQVEEIVDRDNWPISSSYSTYPNYIFPSDKRFFGVEWIYKGKLPSPKRMGLKSVGELKDFFSKELKTFEGKNPTEAVSFICKKLLDP